MPRKKTSKYGYVADFETLTGTKENPIDRTYIWAWAVSSIENPEETQTGSTMEEFVEWCQDKKEVYFHNLGFDCQFIIAWLFENGYTYDEDLKSDKTFSLLKSDMNQVYSLEVTWVYKTSKYFKRTTFYDSYKKLPFSVADIAKAWKLPISKLEIDYTAYRPYGYQMTKEENDYIQNDVKIVAYALKTMAEQGHTKMTIGADCLHYFRGLYDRKRLKTLMPDLSKEEEEFIRKSYRGGFTYVNPKFQNKDLGEGVVFDVNSLYPSRMRYKPMPTGIPVYYVGEYEESKRYPLYVCHFMAEFELKPNHIPTLQIKEHPFFNSREYVKSSQGMMIELTLTSVDFELFKDHYNILAIDYIDGYKFNQRYDIFNEYVDHFMAMKIAHNNEPALRQIDKLFLNNLYGKMATNPTKRKKIPVYNEETEIVEYELTEPEYNLQSYIPIGSFITAYARDLTIRSAQKVYDRFIYADTDSLHLLGTEIPSDVIEIHETELGKWCHESTFTRARFLRAKRYIEEIDGELKVTCSGMPKNLHENVTWENFMDGEEYSGKLMPKTIKGGCVLKEVTFRLK